MDACQAARRALLEVLGRCDVPKVDDQTGPCLDVPAGSDTYADHEGRRRKRVATPYIWCIMDNSRKSLIYNDIIV